MPEPIDFHYGEFELDCESMPCLSNDATTWDAAIDAFDILKGLCRVGKYRVLSMKAVVQDNNIVHIKQQIQAGQWIFTRTIRPS